MTMFGFTFDFLSLLLSVDAKPVTFLQVSQKLTPQTLKITQIPKTQTPPFKKKKDLHFL